MAHTVVRKPVRFSIEILNKSVRRCKYKVLKEMVRQNNWAAINLAMGKGLVA